MVDNGSHQFLGTVVHCEFSHFISFPTLMMVLNYACGVFITGHLHRFRHYLSTRSIKAQFVTCYQSVSVVL